MNRTIYNNKKLIALYFAAMFTGLQADIAVNSTKVSDSKSGCLIVTISGQKVMTDSETGKTIQEKLQEEQKKLTTPLQIDEKKIQDLEKKLMADKDSLEKDFSELDKASKMLSAEAREQKAEALRDRALKFEDKKRELDRMIQKFQADAQKIEKRMTDMYQKEMGKLDGLVKETIKDLAQRNGWEIVLMEESVVFASPKVSKTPMVIEELDKKAKSLNQAKKQALEKELTKVEKDLSKAAQAVKHDTDTIKI